MSPTTIFLAARLVAASFVASCLVAASPALAARAHRPAKAPAAPAFSTNKRATPIVAYGKSDSETEKPRAGWNGFYGGLNGGSARATER
jgi:hypothetical protein